MSMDAEEIVLASRPREGDIVYFPLGRRLFEIKFVEHEQPFYQLGKTYVYELKCELFEYEDELGGWNNENTTVEEIDSILINQGYMTSLDLFSFGQTATATASRESGYVRRVILNNDGYDYTSVPNVSISPAPSGGINATAVAITTQKGGVHSIQSILLTDPGAGYVVPPTVTITGGNGSGAVAICEIVTDYYGTSIVGIQSFGNGYPVAPNVTFSSPSVGLAITARGIVSISNQGTVTQILISDAGIGYTMNPVVTIDPPQLLQE